MIVSSSVSATGEMNEQGRAPMVACERSAREEGKINSYRRLEVTQGKYIHGACFCNSISRRPRVPLRAERGHDALCGDTRCKAQP